MKRPDDFLGIGTLRESSLHRALKEWYFRPGDVLEADIEGFRVDIRRGDEVIEVQTRNFSALRKKLERLLPAFRIRLVHPIALRKWITRIDDKSGEVLGRRKSPRTGSLEDLFLELVSIPDLAANPRVSIEVLLIEEEEVRVNDGRGSWRRRRVSILDHKLLSVVERQYFNEPGDFLRFIPPGMPSPFSSADLSKSSGRPRWLSQKMLYSLRKMNALSVVGRTSKGFLYAA